MRSFQTQGKRSFSEIIDLLIRTSVERRIDILIKVGSFCSGRENELKILSSLLKKQFRTRDFSSLSGFNYQE